MKSKVGISLLLVFTLLSGNTYSEYYLGSKFSDDPAAAVKKNTEERSLEAELIYNSTGLDRYINKDIWNYALTGFRKINPQKQILAIIDFNKPSNEERLFIVDVARKALLFHTLVAHGKNSGGEYATNFSNIEGSLKSSLGFYLTGQTIISPKHGYAMLLNGLERGINDNARDREIIVHSADYVSESFIARNGMLGRSWGCPALPKDLNKQIIDVIKDGAVLFIAGNSPSYYQKSAYLH